MKVSRFIFLLIIISVSCIENSIEPVYTQPEGKLKAVHAPNTNPDSWEYYYYDKNENLIKTERKKDGVISHKTEYSYNSDNLLYTVVYYLFARYSSYQEYLYDENKRLYKINGYGGRPDPVTYTLFEYDDNNHVTSEIQYRTEENKMQKRIVYEYNTSGNISTENFEYFVTGDGSIFQQYKLEYIYKGDLLIEKNVTEGKTYEAGPFELFEYDNQNRLIKMTQIRNRDDSEETELNISLYEYF